MCGEKDIDMVSAAAQIGSPPHVRGKAPVRVYHVFSFGITPACAGKRKQDNGRKSKSGDHPRMCGEKSLFFMASVELKGSPPHVRGKEIESVKSDVENRITPACAGKRNQNSD